jgi:signal transduction histidine kinase
VLGAAPLSGLADLLSAQGEEERKLAELTIGDRIFFASVVAFHGEQGTALGRILTLADVTDMRRMAMEKPRFIRTMVHEFRSPLGAIRSLIEVATEKSLGADLAPYLPFLERADKRIDKMVELIGELLSLSRIDLERTANAADPPADISAAVAATMDLYQGKFAARKIAASVDIAPDLPRAHRRRRSQEPFFPTWWAMPSNTVGTMALCNCALLFATTRSSSKWPILGSASAPRICRNYSRNSSARSAPKRVTSTATDLAWPSSSVWSSA